MPRRLVGLSLAAAVLIVPTACGRGGSLAGMADDIARVTGASAEDILIAARQEARMSSSSADDVTRGWLTSVKTGAQEMSPELKSRTCDAVTDVLADALDRDGTTDVQPVNSVLEALRGANPTVANQTLITELETGLTEVAGGNPVPVSLFVAKAAACAVVAP